MKINIKASLGIFLYCSALSVSIEAAERFYPAYEIPWGTNITCTSEGSVGFNWHEGNWQKFEIPAGSSRLIQKVSGISEEDDTLIDICSKELAIFDDADYSQYGNYAILQRCYVVSSDTLTIQDEGDEVNLQTVELCNEIYKNKQPVSVTCRSTDISFVPNGRYSYSSLMNLVAVGDEKQEPMFIEHGICRTL